MPGRTGERAYPRRSLLYTPADQRERMTKAPDLDCDGVVFDLDDSVPDDHLPEARENVREVTAECDFSETEVVVKLDAVDTPHWLADLEAALESDVDAVAVPKIVDAEQVETVVAVAESHPAPTPEVVLYVETPEGVMNLGDVAAAAGELDACTGMVCSWGDDIMRNMGTIPPRFGDTSVAQSLGDWLSNYVVMAATAAGLDPISYPHVAVHDEESLRERAAFANETGYVGQLALHPGQLDVINDAFTPDEEDVRRAVRLTREFEASETDSLLVEGVFVDQAMAVHYRQLMERYEEIAGTSAAALVE